jgi:ribosomal protein L17
MADIDLKPTAEMAANAARGLELREKHGKGGTAVGVARARDIKNRANLSPETVKRMHSFFSRHEGNQAGGEDDAGYIAWMLWGGDAGKSWAKRKVEQIDGKSESMKSDNNRPGAKAKFQKLSEHMNHIVALCDKVLAVLYRESPDKSLGGVWAKTAQDVHEIKATAHQISRQSWAYSRPNSAEKFSSNPFIATAVKKAQHLRLVAKDLIAALSSGNKDEARRIVSGMRYAVENIDNHIKAFMSRPGAKAKAANNQVDVDKRSEDTYEWVHRRRPKGRGSWAFIAPNESIVFVPGQMTYSEAKKWLKENAPMSGRYKVATQRPGSAAKFGQVGEMLSQIESQSHDQRDLAKSNLRKLAAKIADIDHTREEWERYVRVAKSLGYSESQIAGFSRPGAKASFAILPDGYIRKSDYIKQLLNEIARAFKQKNHEDLKEASHDLLGFAKQLRDEAWRDADDMKKNPQDWSRPGAKAKFDAHWKYDYKQRAADRINEGMELLGKCEEKQREIAKAMKFVTEAISRMNEAVRTRNSSLLHQCEREIYDAHRVRLSFSRPGAKAKFEKSDEYAAILMKPVTVANCGRMMKVAEEAMKYAKSVGDDDLFELAEEVGHECQATKSRASRKEAR